MATGIAVDDNCIRRFNEMKLSKTCKYLIFNMDDKLSNIIVDREGAKEATYEEFQSQLPADDCRYAVVDFGYEGPDGVRNKLIFVNWAPDVAKIKRKMIFASSKVSLKDKLIGISFEVQATDLSEIDYQVVLDKCLLISK
eukprot:EW710721.1.p1 GENE.EW710721.1~~EW710721.1.p1  ORF type:complete len:140 (+),score=62.23 EW710721.1:14-433(+)